MSAVDVLAVPDTIRTLATLVRLHEGNRDAEVNALLERAETCAAAVAELIEAARQIDHALAAGHWPDEDMPALTAALARVGGAA